ncbi:MAG TPA: acyl-CoA dehydrogenase family protein [Streptosporangiaceae bacterium]|nr:acyl-CoA dehydrogenase family protein [Streptosporangiaceae bacterium]
MTSTDSSRPRSSWHLPARPGTAGPAPSTGRIPDLRYTETEEDLRSAVRALLDDRCPWPAVLARAETEEQNDAAAWHLLAAELGCAGLLIPESHGGAGASYREAAVVAEETGRAVAPVPYLGSAVLATAALLPSGDELLPGLAGGEVTAVLAVDFARMPPAAVPGTRDAAGTGLATGVRLAAARPDDPPGQARLTGTVAGVADALLADVLLVPADGVPFGLYAVDAGAPGVSRAAVVSLDATRPLCDLAFDGAPARPVATGEAAVQAVVSALAAGAAMLASEQLGVAQRCLDMTVAYLKERRQFARPVGSFQALKHRAADVWILLAQARAAARYAAACLAGGDPDTPVAIALAKAACGDAAVHAAQECVQMHGGIGFTWEHPAHLLLKRATSGSLALGTPDRHRAALASLVDLPPASA